MTFCNNAKTALVDRLATNQNQKESILAWINKGTTSEIIETLLDKPDENKNFPIWWSGFWLEDPNNGKDILEEMKAASLIVNGYSSVDTLFTSTAFDEQNKFWDSCKYTKKFNWGEIHSETYTKFALRHNPKKIGLFVNKEVHDFEQSNFFITELPLIYYHYKNKNETVDMYIFNKQDNCNGIIESINNKISNTKNTINLICVVCEKSLENCASQIKLLNTPPQSGGIGINSYKSKKIYKRKKTYKKNKLYKRKKTYKKTNYIKEKKHIKKNTYNNK